MSLNESESFKEYKKAVDDSLCLFGGCTFIISTSDLSKTNILRLRNHYRMSGWISYAVLNMETKTDEIYSFGCGAGNII